MGTHKHHSVLVVLSLFILPISAATADITTGLVSHWMLDDGAGSVALDSVGNNHGTLQGDAAWAEGYVAGAILLDGAGDYIDCGNSATFNITDAVTLAAWVQAKGDFAYPDWSGIIMRGGANIDTFALYYHKGSERLGFKTTGTTPNWLATATGAAKAIFDGEWHHTAATYDGKTKIIYLDGVQAGNATASGKIETSTGRVLLGAGRDTNPPTLYVAGWIDDARIYSRALSLADVKELIPPKLQARQPNPADGANGVLVPLFGWTAGDTAVLHDVYMGKSPDLGPANIVAFHTRATVIWAEVTLEPGVTYYWRVDEIEADGETVHAGNIWSFTVMALMAYRPNPADGAPDASTTPNLTWLPGQGAIQHHVYFGGSSDAVSQGAPETDKGIRALADANFAPGMLDALTTWYWRVDEILPDKTVRPGPVWSFTTYLLVDDFESYTDEIGQRIFQTWLDGVGYTEPTTVPGNGSGSTVGYALPPFAEQKIVHGGKQSMPMDYNNVDAPNYSAAQRTFSPPADWTVNGATTLVVFLRGKTTNKPTTLYLSIEDASSQSARTEPFDQAMVTRAQWTEWRIPISLFTALGVDMTGVKQVKIGVYDNVGAGSATGTLYIDDIRVIRVTP
jgi:hypothetical protein